jgi:hypothetical protein
VFVAVLLMVLITFYVTLVDTALSPGNSEAGEFDDVDVIYFVFIFERCVVSFTPVGTALSPGSSEEEYTVFASRSCCSPCVDDDAADANAFASTSCWSPCVTDDATAFASTSCWLLCVADDVDNVLFYSG